MRKTKKKRRDYSKKLFQLEQIVTFHSHVNLTRNNDHFNLILVKDGMNKYVVLHY